MLFMCRKGGIDLKIKSCTLDEMKKAIEEGKKIVVYGDRVIYDTNSNIEPHKWYREQISDANIAVEIGILEEN